MQHNTSCYKYSDTPLSSEEAANSCRRNKSHLVAPDTVQEKYFASNFLSNRGSDSLWVAARYKQDDYTYWLWQWIWTGGPKSKIGRPVPEVITDYDKYVQDVKEKPCATLSSQNHWKSADCQAKLPFLCEKDPPCADGWYGEGCSAACHCSGFLPCDHETGLCPHGCAAGWTGSACTVSNRLPQATYHCLRTWEGALLANLTVNPYQRVLRMVRAVADDGTPLSCHLDARKTRNDEWFVPLSLKNAFHEENMVVSDIATSDDENMTDSNNSSSSIKDVTELSINDTIIADDETVIASTKVDNRGTQEGVKLDGQECIASRDANNTVTWLIEFKQFEGATTDDDVTIEVTCDLDDADNMATAEVVMDDSQTDRRMYGSESSVLSEVYLTDAKTGQRLDEYHTGHILRLHVDVIGLTSNECATPSTCVLRPVDAEQTKVVLTEENGCPAAGSPVTEWQFSRTTGGGDSRQEVRYETNPFSAVSLGTSQLQIECKLNIVFQANFYCLELLNC